MDVFQRFARLATTTVSRRPWLWPLFRRPLRAMFDRIAADWDSGRSPTRTTAFAAGLELVPSPPRRALDLGTGTGDAAFVLARRWPETEVLGLDLSERMVAAARAKTPPELDGRVRFAVGDSRRVPADDGAFDLVGLNNMIPFFAELARVTAPGGHVVVAASSGPQTPIYVPPARVRAELERHGFEDVREVAAGRGSAIVARRSSS